MHYKEQAYSNLNKMYMNHFHTINIEMVLIYFTFQIILILLQCKNYIYIVKKKGITINKKL